MIGQLLDNSKVIAVLDDNGEWKASDELIQARLQSAFDPKYDNQSSFGFPFGYMTLYRAAESLGLTPKPAVVIPPAKPGVVN